MRKSFTVLSLLLFAVSTALALTPKVKSVTDGDTFVLVSGERVRLIGIDAPESKDSNKPVEYMAKESAEYLRQLIDGQDVRLEFGDERQDKYGRLLCYVWIDSLLVNKKMVEDGYATAYLRFPHAREQEFVEAELRARRSALGMWSSPRSNQARVAETPASQLYDQVEATAAASEIVEGTDSTSTDIVYVTASGSKFHSQSCSYLKGGGIAKTKSEAIASGYSACSRCGGVPGAATANAAATKTTTPTVSTGRPVGTTATGKTIYEGPRGGKYHISKSGKKVYEKKKKR